MIRTASTIAASLLLLTHALLAGPSDQKWDLVGSKDDITTYRREVAGSPIVAIKGEGTVDASIARVASVLLDTTRLIDWMGSLKEAHRLRSMGPLSYIEYDHVSTPFPLTDREFVTESRGELNSAKRRVILPRPTPTWCAATSSPAPSLWFLSTVARALASSPRSRLIPKAQSPNGSSTTSRSPGHTPPSWACARRYAGPMLSTILI